MMGDKTHIPEAEIRNWTDGAMFRLVKRDSNRAITWVTNWQRTDGPNPTIITNPDDSGRVFIAQWQRRFGSEAPGYVLLSERIHNPVVSFEAEPPERRLRKLKEADTKRRIAEGVGL